MCSCALSIGIKSPILLPGPVKNAISISKSSSRHGPNTGALAAKGVSHSLFLLGKGILIMYHLEQFTDSIPHQEGILGSWDSKC